ncbi:MAG: Flp pilus assembly protein CpaB [Lentisphaeria bacterium]|nr:Flp pilus assembly protein CpaB [Lentisphaeria bacterium]
MKQKLLLLGAVFFGVLAFMFTYRQITLERQKIQGEAQDVYLIQVVKDIPEGEKITDDMIRQKKEKRFRSQSQYSREIPYDQRNMVIGREVRQLVSAGRLLQWSDLKISQSSGRTGLTAKIRPGFRAISIPVNQHTSVTGMVQPNNYVDLIATFRFPERQGDKAMDTITLTILQHVKVLATGTDMGIISAANGNGNSRSSSYSTVTLELTPKEVEMIVFTLQKAGAGSITLSLRHYEESRITDKLQSVDYKYLESHYRAYTEERKKLMNLDR